jgi:hypothetical protein
LAHPQQQSPSTIRSQTEGFLNDRNFLCGLKNATAFKKWSIVTVSELFQGMNGSPKLCILPPIPVRLKIYDELLVFSVHLTVCGSHRSDRMSLKIEPVTLDSIQPVLLERKRLFGTINSLELSQVAFQPAGGQSPHEIGNW